MTINIQKVQTTPSREGGMVGRRWSPGMHCPAISHCHAAKQVTGSWGEVRGAAAILNGPAEVICSCVNKLVASGV